MSAHWLEITDKPPVHTAATLDPSDIYPALAAGKAVMWQDWSLRASQPRPSREDNGASRPVDALHLGQLYKGI